MTASCILHRAAPLVILILWPTNPGWCWMDFKSAVRVGNAPALASSDVAVQLIVDNATGITSTFFASNKCIKAECVRQATVTVGASHTRRADALTSSIITQSACTLTALTRINSTVAMSPDTVNTEHWPCYSSVPPGVKDVFVWLTETPAPSDFCI